MNNNPTWQLTPMLNAPPVLSFGRDGQVCWRDQLLELSTDIGLELYAFARDTPHTHTPNLEEATMNKEFTQSKDTGLADAGNHIILVNGGNQVLRVHADGSIMWKGETLDTAPEVGRALTEFIRYCANNGRMTNA